MSPHLAVHGSQGPPVIGSSSTSATPSPMAHMYWVKGWIYLTMLPSQFRFRQCSPTPLCLCPRCTVYSEGASCFYSAWKTLVHPWRPNPAVTSFVKFPHLQAIGQSFIPLWPCSILQGPQLMPLTRSVFSSKWGASWGQALGLLILYPQSLVWCPHGSLVKVCWLNE